MGNYTNEWIKLKFEKLRKEYKNKCYFCKSKNNLEFAHIKPTELDGRGRGRKERYYDIIKHKDCYRLFCRKCHKTFDNINLSDDDRIVMLKTKDLYSYPV